MPVYNKRDMLETIVERVLSVDVPKELIVVDDGSTDESSDLIRKLAQAHPGSIRAVFCEKNRGKGAAVRVGYEIASGDVCVIQDADLELDTSEYALLLRPIIEDGADVVYGSRFAGQGRQRLSAAYLGNRLLTFVTNVLYGTRLTDMATCYKAIRTEVVNALALESDGFEIEPETTAKLALGGWKIHEVPISYSPRTIAEGKKLRWYDGIMLVRVLFRYRLRRA
jgi:glycosyltransferase involved in cell wall biosynthesis